MSAERIEAWLASSLAPDQREDLEVWLTEDEENRLQLLQEAVFQEELRLLHRRSSWTCPADEVAELNEETKRSSHVFRWPLLLGLVALLVVATFLALRGWSGPVADPQDGVGQSMALNPDDPSRPTSVAVRTPVVVGGSVRFPSRYTSIKIPAKVVAETDEEEGVVQWGADVQVALGSHARVLLASSDAGAKGAAITLERGSLELRPVPIQEPRAVASPFTIHTEGATIKAQGARFKVAFVHLPEGKMVSVSVASGEVKVEASWDGKSQTVRAGGSVLLPLR